MLNDGYKMVETKSLFSAIAVLSPVPGGRYSVELVGRDGTYLAGLVPRLTIKSALRYALWYAPRLGAYVSEARRA